MKLNMLLGTVFVLFLITAGFSLLMYGWLLALCLLGGGAFAALVLLLIGRAKHVADDAIEDLSG